ncbi:amidohydrolase [Rhodococcus aetherivorans]|uniref:amidohydrolase n=1 Tax=Rhodococcus aetherivorans TaxID=191292 RepID=UPI002949F90F|nr:amidohydrolase family protein [Rhodococcus aetherivorans]MDV6292141.1 amidohydrolase family protein [Rhodococcus aetherivorans]
MSSPAPRTQLLVGGRIYSASAPDATSMAVTDGQVVWVGEDRPGRALHPDAETVDLDGAFVAPAFVDTHVHVTAHGLALTGLDLSGTPSREDALHRLRDHAARHADAVVWGHGWDETRWPDPTAPTTDDLDAAAPGRAVYLTRVDAHSAAASTALRAATDLVGLDGYHPQRPLTAAAHHTVRAAARALLTPAQRARARAAALDDYAAHGIVAVHECGGPDIAGRDDFAELLATDHAVQVRGYWGEAVTTADQARALLAATGGHALGGDLFVDGALGSHTAWLAAPYTDRPDCCGTAYLTVEQMAAHLRACTEAGIQAGFHVIGDAAVDAAVQAFAAVVAELGGPAVAARGHRLEHLEMVTAEQTARLGGWGVIASMQPAFDALWGGPDGLYATRLGADRAAGLNPFAPLAATGMSLAFGSDAPVTAARPWPMLRAAVHHRTPGSGISPRAAFAAATRGAWRAGGVRDGVAGTLDPGAPASYAIWEADELVVSAPKDSVQRWSTDPRSRVAPLPDLEPGTPDPVLLRSVHRGRVVYAR